MAFVANRLHQLSSEHRHTTHEMKPRSVTLQRFFRTYTTARRRVDKRRPERPPHRPPDPLINNPDATVSRLRDDENLTFIHRRPPTSPSPHSLTTAPTSPLLRPAPSETIPWDDSPPPPPLLRPSAEVAEALHQQRQTGGGGGRVSEEIVAEIRRLRLANPEEYSRGRLAKMFGCTQSFVASVAALPKSVRRGLVRKREEEHGQVRAGWGEKKELVRAIRAKRREEW